MPKTCHFKKLAKIVKKDNFFQLFWKKCQVFVNFLTFKWQFSGGSGQQDFVCSPNNIDTRHGNVAQLKFVYYTNYLAIKSVYAYKLSLLIVKWKRHICIYANILKIDQFSPSDNQ